MPFKQIMCCIDYQIKMVKILASFNQSKTDNKYNKH